MNNNTPLKIRSFQGVEQLCTRNQKQRPNTFLLMIELYYDKELEEFGANGVEVPSGSPVQRLAVGPSLSCFSAAVSYVFGRLLWQSLHEGVRTGYF